MYKNKDTKFSKKNQFKKIIYVNYRFFILYSFIFLSLIFLVLRIFFVQIINSNKLTYEGDKRTLKIQSVPIIRGMINDRSGNPLAVTVLVNAICGNPTILSNQKNIANDPRWKALSEILSIPINKIIFDINKNKKSKFFYLARQVTPEIGEYIQKLQLSGVSLLEEFKRYYTTGKITAQLIGLTNIDGKGIEGIEKSFNSLLMGNPGKRKIRTNRKGEIIEKTSLTDGTRSNNLNLSIDKKLQTIVYNELRKAVKENKADSGTAVLIDIKTGEVLAMANSPSYNPNNIKHAIKKNIRNRAITDMFEPGSTIKPIVIMEGLKLGLIKKDSIINTNPYPINKHMIKDVSYYNQLNITGILKKSSNVGISKIALSIPTSKLIDSYTQFGIGKPTELGLIGEKNGFFPQKKNGLI